MLGKEQRGKCRRACCGRKEACGISVLTGLPGGQTGTSFQVGLGGYVVLVVMQRLLLLQFAHQDHCLPFPRPGYGVTLV